jgi:hypothetical protein
VIVLNNLCVLKKNGEDELLNSHPLGGAVSPCFFGDDLRSCVGIWIV